ncbi:MAG TPA: NAD+ synthase [Candidatus Limnocylindrales bacterium]|nr:NAD+ synthase [Candidatus Limnocylindrales bacterium]
MPPAKKDKSATSARKKASAAAKKPATSKSAHGAKPASKKAQPKAAPARKKSAHTAKEPAKAAGKKAGKSAPQKKAAAKPARKPAAGAAKKRSRVSEPAIEAIAGGADSAEETLQAAERHVGTQPSKQDHESSYGDAGLADAAGDENAHLDDEAPEDIERTGDADEAGELDDEDFDVEDDDAGLAAGNAAPADAAPDDDELGDAEPDDDEFDDDELDDDELDDDELDDDDTELDDDDLTNDTDVADEDEGDEATGTGVAPAKELGFVAVTAPAATTPEGDGIPKTEEPLAQLAKFPSTNYAVVEKILVGFLASEVRKVGLSRAVLGLSGGVDSAVSAAIAARALGGENVLGVMMPYQTSSPESVADALAVAASLGIETMTVEITAQVDAYFERFPDASRLRRGNKMARERMTILYDHSAARSALVVGTSNKTELLLGYGTLYGDMASALNPIGDLYKTQVWGLARHLALPPAVIEKAPTADLWSGQTDENELGFSYHEVDRLLYWMIDERCSFGELEAMGFEREFIERIARMVRRSQFKRRLPIIAKISARTVDPDFRYSRDLGL